MLLRVPLPLLQSRQHPRYHRSGLKGMLQRTRSSGVKLAKDRTVRVFSIQQGEFLENMTIEDTAWVTRTAQLFEFFRVFLELQWLSCAIPCPRKAGT